MANRKKKKFPNKSGSNNFKSLRKLQPASANILKMREAKDS